MTPNDGTPHAAVLREVLQERVRHIELGYTPERDDGCDFGDWWYEIERPLWRARHSDAGHTEQRAALLQAATAAVAALEAMDRRARAEEVKS